jgi:hypothetical protein
MKRFKHYIADLTESKASDAYAAALQQFHGNSSNYISRKTKKDPTDLTRDEIRAFKKVLDANRAKFKSTQELYNAVADHYDIPVATLQHVEKTLKESTEQERKDYIKSLQLTLTADDLTDAQLKDFARRSNGGPSSPNQISAKADVDAMSPNHLKQVIAHKRVHVFFKNHARQRLSGNWK